jgi:hypothetical protein
MPSCHHRCLVFLSYPVLMLLGGCNPKVECDSPETRNEVLKIISDDHRDALATYAARKSNVAGDVEKSANSESAKAVAPSGRKDSHQVDECG